MAKRHRARQQVQKRNYRKDGLRFMGSTTIRSTSIKIGYLQGFIEESVLNLTGNSLAVLGGIIENIQTNTVNHKSEPKLEVLLGLSCLTFMEGHALLTLCSTGLERSARIHYRSIHEYKRRAEILLAENEKSEDFIFAALFEMQRLGAMLEIPQKQIEEAKKRFLGPARSTLPASREKDIFGDWRAYCKKLSGNDKMYATTVTWPSLISHGSILAVREISDALRYGDKKFQEALTRDGQGVNYLLGATSMILHFCMLISEHFKKDIEPHIKDLFSEHERLAQKHIQGVRRQ